MRALLTTSLVLLLVGCTGLTELMVVVDTDLEAPEEIDLIRIDVDGLGRQPVIGAVLPGAQLPVQLGLVHEGGPLGPISITAIAYEDFDEQVVERRARVFFVENSVRLLRIDLLRRCVGVTCDSGQTCGETGCRPIDVDPTELAVWTGPPQSIAADASAADAADAGMDTGAPTDTGVATDTSAPLDTSTPVDSGAPMDGAADTLIGPDAAPDARADTSDAEVPDSSIIFITADVFTTTAVGSVAGANRICDREARRAGLPGDYGALLSDTSIDARDNLSTIGYPIVRVDGRTVEATDLWDGTGVEASIQHADGSTRVHWGAWTGTESDGRLSTWNCNDWSSFLTSARGAVGIDATDLNWAFVTPGQLCNTSHALYCVQTSD